MNKCIWYITKTCKGEKCKCKDYIDRRYKLGKELYDKYVKEKS